MMCIYHLINPDAPKFLPACVACGKDITSPFKWTCAQSCEDVSSGEEERRDGGTEGRREGG